MEEVSRPITEASCENEREMQISLKRNGQVEKKARDGGKRDNDGIQTHDPNNVLAKLNGRPKEEAWTRILATLPLAPTTQP